MKDRENLHDELEEQAPFLRPLKEAGDGLRVPDGYFDQLESEVYRQLDALGARPNPAAFPSGRRETSWWQALQRLWQPRLPRTPLLRRALRRRAGAGRGTDRRRFP